ncbi:hypothetical protein [Clostridium sp. E02]|nr:hypothetical protein [Clostridium sp. E02]
MNFVNAYGSNQENVRATIEKICGKSKFCGTANDKVFCDDGIPDCRGKN